MQKAFIDQQMQKRDDKPIWWRSFSSYNHRENMKMAVLSSKFWWQIADSSFLELRNQMVMFIITSRLNSAFGTIGKARGVKWQQKRLVKTQVYALAWLIICTCGDAVKHVCEIWNIFLLLTRFLHVCLNEKLLLLTFSVHFFHLVPCIWE